VEDGMFSRSSLPLVEREDSIMQEVQERMDRLSWIRQENAGHAVSLGEPPSKSDISRSVKTTTGIGSETSDGTSSHSGSSVSSDSFSEVDEAKTSCMKASTTTCSISFKLALTGPIVAAMLLACTGVIVPVKALNNWMWTSTTKYHREAKMDQHKLLEKLVADESFIASRRVLLDLRWHLVAQVIQPMEKALDTLWGTMKTLRFQAPSWNGRSQVGREVLAHRAWLELADDMQSPIFREHASAYSGGLLRSLYATFTTEQLAGATLQPGISESPNFLVLDAPGGSRGMNTVLHAWSVDSKTGTRLALMNSTTHLPSSNLAYIVQANLSVRGGTPSRAWTPLYILTSWTGGQTCLGWSRTAPITYCGDFSCFDGVIAVDVAAFALDTICQDSWERLRQNRSTDMTFPVTHESVAVFIVGHASPEFGTHEGALISESGADETRSKYGTTMAIQSSRPVVSIAAKAIISKFGSWSAHQLVDSVNSFSFRPSSLASGNLLECDPLNASLESDRDCVTVGSLSLDLGDGLRWLLVASLPAGAFHSVEAGLANAARSKFRQNLQELQALHDVYQGYIAALVAVMMLLSILIGCCISRLISRPLRQLRSFMQRMRMLDFARDSEEMKQLFSGELSRVREVNELQADFCRLSSGMEVFARFVPQSVVQNVVRGDERMRRLHVSRRRVTIMFSDIKDFTSISESLPQRDLLFVLTLYLTVMTRIVESTKGVVGEILGDGLLVFWNTPEDVEHHAANACSAALAQQNQLVHLNEELAELGFPHLAIRIGLHTGDVLTGNIGSATKMKFGCMGDPMNLASRLEGLCKHYGAGVLMSGATRKELPASERFVVREVDLVQVKGKREPTRVFELLGYEMSTANSPEVPWLRREQAAKYEKALKAFQAARFGEASQLAREALALDPQDVAAKKLLDRSLQPALEPSELANWTGVNQMLDK